ncbi:MAG: SDR family oxidoreductase [Deltaproteobacteria bacterium]|nr:SDR family oxidoreductase [Deltaproteobacteria bacterium]
MASDIFELREKVIVVTGGMGQLGRQFTMALVERGARVAVFDTKASDDALRSRLFDHMPPERVLFLPVDITSRNSIEDGLREVLEQWHAPEGLINNAALDSPPDAPAEENGPFETYPESSWDTVMETNVKGVFLCSQVIGGKMSRSGGGSIVNICSTYGMVSPDQRIYEYRREEGKAFYKPVAYSASKSAILNITRYLSTYWAKAGVRVNTLTLGGVFNDQDSTFLERYCQKVPMGRMAYEWEYNGAIIFLLSGASSYMTGSNLVIDGGWTAW